MSNPVYKSIKITFATWQVLTRISAATGETRSTIVERLARLELERLQRSIVENISQGDRQSDR